MAGFRCRRRAPGAAQQDGDGRDSNGVAPARRGLQGSRSDRIAAAGDRDSAGPSVGLSVEEVAASRPKATAVEYGISMLAARSWPEKKLREKIRARYSQDDTDAGIERLRELRLVDDESWAERYARDRFERLGKGRARIRLELIGKGIAAATADAALARVVASDDERAKAAATLETLKARLARSPGASRSGLAGRGAARGIESGIETDGSESEPDLDAGPEARAEAPEAGGRVDPRERRAQAERLKNRLFRRMLARGFPASVVRDLLDVS